MEISISKAQQHSSSSSSSLDNNTHLMISSSSSSSSSYTCGHDNNNGCITSYDNNCSAIRSRKSRDLSTDLRLGLSISHYNNHDLDNVSSTSTQREEVFDHWPPIKPFLRSTLAGQGNRRGKVVHDQEHESTLFVKVYMEGIPIGRKLDLFAHDDYNALITTLRHMFRTTTILRPKEVDHHGRNKGRQYVLTYEDNEGDWMMVGDVPWEMFLTNVRRLKITRADRC